MNLRDKMRLICGRSNEIAFGYSDSGVFWRFQWGERGCGSMMKDFGQTWCSEADDFDEAVDEFLVFLGYDLASLARQENDE